MNSNRLRELFTWVPRASLASALLLTGCGGLDLEGYSPPACMKLNLAVSDLTPAVPTDFIELRRLSGVGRPPPFEVSILSSSGTACTTASDPATCHSDLEALTPAAGFNTICDDLRCRTHYLVTSRGDVVAVHDSVESLLGFLGTIDTPQEAVLRVFADDARSYEVSCSTLEQGAVKANADGTFDVVATTGTGCQGEPSMWRHVLRVSPQGEVRETRSELLARASPGNCGD